MYKTDYRLSFLVLKYMGTGQLQFLGFLCPPRLGDFETKLNWNSFEMSVFLAQWPCSVFIQQFLTTSIFVQGLLKIHLIILDLPETKIFEKFPLRQVISSL